MVQQRVGGRGLQRISSLAHYDEIIYVGQLLSGGRVPGMEGVHRAPRRELGSGVLVGLEQTSGELSGIAADLRRLADANKIPFATDYSAAVTPKGIPLLPISDQMGAHRHRGRMAGHACADDQR